MFYQACSKTLSDLSKFLGTEWKEFLGQVREVYESEIKNMSENSLKIAKEEHKKTLEKHYLTKIENLCNEIDSRDAKIVYLESLLKEQEERMKSSQSKHDQEVKHLHKEISKLQISVSSEKDARKLIIADGGVAASFTHHIAGNDKDDEGNGKDSIGFRQKLFTKRLANEWKSVFEQINQNFDNFMGDCEKKMRNLESNLDRCHNSISTMENSKVESNIEKMEKILNSVLSEVKGSKYNEIASKIENFVGNITFTKNSDLGSLLEELKDKKSLEIINILQKCILASEIGEEISESKKNITENLSKILKIFSQFELDEKFEEILGIESTELFLKNGMKSQYLKEFDFIIENIRNSIKERYQQCESDKSKRDLILKIFKTSIFTINSEDFVTEIMEQYDSNNFPFDPLWLQ